MSREEKLREILRFEILKTMYDNSEENKRTSFKDFALANWDVDFNYFEK